MYEKWKDIKGYKGLYKISNKGRVYSYITNKILKHGYTPLGYKFVWLVKNKTKKANRICRLVGIHFLELPKDYKKLVINHKDENPSNDNVNNLEWMTQKENCNYGNRNKKLSIKLKNRKDMSRAVIQYSKELNYINTFESQQEAERITKIKSPNISECCHNKRKTAGGFIWRFVNA